MCSTLEFAVERVICPNDLLAVLIEDLSLTGQPEFFFAAFNQEGFERPFQRTDLLAYGRLSDFVDLRGFGKTLGFGQVTEDFEALNLHKNNEY